MFGPQIYIMAILGPSELPLVLKIDSNPLKALAIKELGHPVVLVELMEPQFECELRRIGDFIAEYFPLEERYAFFMTQPLQAEYPLPEDAYWIRNVNWDPATTRLDDIFGAESFLFNIGNISGIQNILTDYHLLQAYRKFSQRILGTEGQWEFKPSSDGGPSTIRLFPVPRGSFPVIIEYLPTISEFKKPSNKELTIRAFLARMKMILGRIRGKYQSGIPGPDGSMITFDGDSLIQEGKEEWDQVIDDAIKLGEPLGPYLW